VAKIAYPLFIGAAMLHFFPSRGSGALGKDLEDDIFSL
jgi:hypothetical protein